MEIGSAPQENHAQFRSPWAVNQLAITRLAPMRAAELTEREAISRAPCQVVECDSVPGGKPITGSATNRPLLM